MYLGEGVCKLERWYPEAIGHLGASEPGGDCEPPECELGTELKSSTRTEHAFNR